MAGRRVLNQVGPEGGRDKLLEVTALPASLVSECILDFVEKVLVWRLHCAICVHPGEGDNRPRAVHDGHRVKRGWAWKTLSKRSPVAALTVCLNRVSHQGEGRKPLVIGFMGRVPARFAMSPTQ